MKKYLVLITSICCLQQVTAQWNFGVRSGVNWAKLMLPSTENFIFVEEDFGLGYQAGIWGTYSFSRKVAVQSELAFIFSRNTIDQVFLTTGDQLNAKVISHAFSFPILFNFYPVSRLKLSTGFDFIYNFRTKIIIETVNTTRFFEEPLSSGWISGFEVNLLKKLNIGFRFTLASSFFELDELRGSNFRNDLLNRLEITDKSYQLFLTYSLFQGEQKQ